MDAAFQPLRLWVDEGRKIVSFHPEDGFSQLRFDCLKEFMDYAEALVEKRYRFQ